MRRLVHDIHEGKNLEKNLVKYKDLAIPLYMEYAALELTFSAFTMIQEIMEERKELAEREKAAVDVILAALDTVGRHDPSPRDEKEGMEGESGGDVSGQENNFVYRETAGKMRELREEITQKMDLFTAYTDRLICYEYVLNRMEYKYMPEDELNRQLASFDEEAYLRELLAYLFVDKDQSVVRDKLRMIMGQIPVYMTKGKFFERIREALTLYRDSDRAALDDFLYMIRTSAMVYEPQHYAGEYEGMEDWLGKLSEADYVNMPEEDYEEYVTLLEQGAKAVHEMTDFYYSLQKVVNCIFAVCRIFPYCGEQTKLVRACRSIWVCLAKREYMDEMLRPLEGRIEDKVEKTSYMESVLFEIKSSYKKELERCGLTDFFEDFSVAANLLSDSLFIDLEKVAKMEKVDAEYMSERTESLLEELATKLKSVSRPVKRAIMAQVLDKLPMAFTRSEEVEEYLRVNLLGCQDKAEKCTVMVMLRDLVK